MREGHLVQFLRLCLLVSYFSFTFGQEGDALHPCPNGCSKHGRCFSPSRQCECFDGYTGADCSLRICPFDKAWADLGVNEDDAHRSAECSNKGLCDRGTGICICQDGFEGIACERQSCPSNCNSVGECQSMYYYALTKDPGSGQVYTYNNVWDAHKIYGCRCDSRYHGTDCSLRYCPKGDDPLTGTEQLSPLNPAQYNDLQRISCKADGGTFTLTFRGKTTFPIPFNAKVYEVQSKLEALPSIGQGGLKIIFYGPQACIDYGTTFTVEFLQNFGDLPLFVPDQRKLSLSNSLSNAVLAVAKVRAGTKEDLECSNRGICDTQTGTCSCALDFETSNGYDGPGTRGDCGYTGGNLIQYCPGIIACSGHGLCKGNPTYTCQCEDGWIGADCSERECPKDLAWFSLPEGNDRAHLSIYAECSNVGLCDRSTGMCQCNTGFTGSACSRFTCPGITPEAPEGGCNGHGQCLDMSSLAKLTKVNGVKQTYTYGNIPNDPSTWDALRIFGCYCDAGFEGYDCSLLSCPTGDDPLTRGQSDEVQILACTDSDNDGSIVLTFRDESTPPLRPSATTADVKTALESLSTIEEVVVEVLDPASPDTFCTAAGNQFAVTFLTEHGDLPIILYAVNDINSFSVTELTTGSKENLECAGRGLCNHETGQCECFVGYGSSDGKGNAGSKRDCAYAQPISGYSLSP